MALERRQALVALEVLVVRGAELGQVALDATQLLGRADGGWRTVKIKLSCFRNRGADVTQITAPIRITTSGRLALSISELKLAANDGDAVCPAD